MEDYFYIVVGILWIVFSVVKATRNKRQLTGQPPQKQADQPGSRSILEDVLNDLLEVEKRKPVVVNETTQEVMPETDYTSLEENPPLYGQYSGVLEETSQPVLESEYSMEEDKTPQPLTQTYFTEKEEAIQDDWYELRKAHFDLKKAVIYSAILQRPYA